MKILDALIIVLVVLVVSSGGFLGYLVYTDVLSEGGTTVIPSNNSDDTEINQLDSDTTPEVVCIDNDGDGYGEGCENGQDCDDEDRSRNEECKELEGMVTLVPAGEATTYAVGDTIELDIVLDGVPVMGQDEDAGVLQIRVDFDTTVLEYASFKPNSDGGYSLPIELESEDRYVVDMAIYEGIKSGDVIGTLKFEAIESGTANLSVGDDTRLFVVYEIEGGELEITVE